MKLTDKFRGFWTEDRAVLMTCIGIALCFWILNKLSTSVSKNLNVKIEYRLPEGKALSTIPPQSALVTVRGTGWDILTGKTEGNIILDLNQDSVQMFSLRNAFYQKTFAEIVNVSPDLITIFTEEAVSKQVRIEPQSNIQFDKGYNFAEDIQLNPSVVTISGPKSFIERVRAIRTDTLVYKNFNGKVVKKISLLPHPVLTYNISETEATIVSEQMTEKSMFIPIMVKNAPQQLKIFPNKIKLDCTVALSHYAQLNPNNFVAEVDLKGVSLNSPNNTVPIILSQQPSFVRNVKFTPQSAEFYFEK